MMATNVASEVIAKYAIVGPRVELQRTLPLESGEDLVAGLRVTARCSADSMLGRISQVSGGRRGFLRISTRRLCIVRHYGFIRDRIIVIPPDAIIGVKGRGLAESLELTFRGEGGDLILTIVTWRPLGPQPNLAALNSRDLPQPLRELAVALGAPDLG